jgi:hypothetical protein
MNQCPPRSTLFLHEDIVVRTLAYERDLKQWRLDELEAGRGDPGRPSYEQVSDQFNLFSATHRYCRYSVG